MIEKFTDWRPITRSEHLLNVIRRLTDPVLEEGEVLTPSQVFRLLLDEDQTEETPKAYSRLLELLNLAHLGGALDWNVGIDQTPHFHGAPGGIEVWVERDDLVPTVLRALDGWQAGVMSTRGNPSTSAIYQAVGRDPVAILYFGGDDEPSWAPRLRALGYVGELFPMWVVEPERHLSSNVAQSVRDEVSFHFATKSMTIPVLVDHQAGDLREELDAMARREAELTADLRRADEKVVRHAGLRTALVDAMDSVGDTTRAVALKRKIAAIIDDEEV